MAEKPFRFSGMTTQTQAAEAAVAAMPVVVKGALRLSLSDTHTQLLTFIC